MTRHLTARGDFIDMESLIAQNSMEKALGNAKMNARGDLINDKGIVLKTQEQIEAEWAAQRAKDKLLSGQPKNIKSPLEQMVGAQPKPMTNEMMSDKDFDPSGTHTDANANSTTSAPRRRIVETE